MTDLINRPERRGFYLLRVSTILFAVIIFLAALNRIIPVGRYERAASEALGKDVQGPGRYPATSAVPRGIFDVILVLHRGFLRPGGLERMETVVDKVRATALQARELGRTNHKMFYDALESPP